MDQSIDRRSQKMEKNFCFGFWRFVASLGKIICYVQYFCELYVEGMYLRPSDHPSNTARVRGESVSLQIVASCIFAIITSFDQQFYFPTSQQAIKVE